MTARRKKAEQNSLVWFRGKDLRLADHHPLLRALEQGDVTLLFVIDPYFFEPSRAQQLPHRMQFLLESLSALQQEIRIRGGELLLVAGPSVLVVPQVARALGSTQVLAHRWSEPFGMARDERVAKNLDVPFHLYEGETLLPPGSVLTKAGTPYAVFTPFSRAARQKLVVPQPERAPSRLPPLQDLPPEVEALRCSLPTLTELGLERNSRILSGGEDAARSRLKTFVHEKLAPYQSTRDNLADAGTSRLSCDLKFGTISVRSAWRAAEGAPHSSGRTTFLTQLLWREFAYAVMNHRPDVLEHPYRSDFGGFPYNDDEDLWNAWCAGTTGIPIVDAAARQLLREGYVENRARMISASFLTKNLLLPYWKGEAHYMRYLADGDWALNNMGWQWTAGCGVDAAPYFRVFNPVLQGKKFDKLGLYVRRLVPELARMPERFIHNPWEAPPHVLEAAGVQLGENYPLPVVDLKQSSARFLATAKSFLQVSRSRLI